jgi:hypothetical protein
MPYAVRLGLLVLVSVGLWYALRRLGFRPWVAYVLSSGSVLALSAFVQYGLGITYR